MFSSRCPLFYRHPPPIRFQISGFPSGLFFDGVLTCLLRLAIGRESQLAELEGKHRCLTADDAGFGRRRTLPENKPLLMDLILNRFVRPTLEHGAQIPIGWMVAVPSWFIGVKTPEIFLHISGVFLLLLLWSAETRPPKGCLKGMAWAMTLCPNVCPGSGQI